MSFDDEKPFRDESPGRLRIELNAGGFILFESRGFRVALSRGRKLSRLHLYESLTHVFLADNLLLIGSTSGLLTIRNRRFRDPERGPAEVRRRLLQGRAEVARDGEEGDWAQRMREIEDLGNRKSVQWITWLTAALCVLGTAFQLRDPMIEQVGAFIPDLFVRGEFWRAVTAHFLHGMPWLPLHLAFNVGGLLVLGPLIERPLGSWRMGVILGGAALGTVVGILITDQSTVIGASGLVAGLAGAALSLELNHSDSLPAFWRLPRRLFIGALIVQFVVIDQLMSNLIAGGAHLGGFTGGYLSALLLGGPGLAGLIPTPRIRLAGYLTMAGLVAGVFGALPLVRHEMGALERHASRLLNTPSETALYPLENAAAWFLVTEGGVSATGLDDAVALADRAVRSTRRMNPGILDTLAETLFQQGDFLGALLTIEEAIRLMPNESYFIEQRRRFIGERGQDDRPPPPGSVPKAGPAFDDGFRPQPLDPNVPRMTI
ncbi:MAG: rhomboid family intramembrane serine protease [Myxococcota bacterium]